MTAYEDGMEAIYIEGRRNGYGPDQCGSTMTVRDMIEFLQDYDEDTPIFIKNDGGYTYGNITRDSIMADYGEGSEEE